MKTICQHNRPSDICGVCNPIASKPRSIGMRECYTAFMAIYPWRQTNLPTFEAWILSDDDDTRKFRQGWAARAGKDW